MAERPIYLDHNATTPLLPEVLAAMLPYLETHFGNPSSSHAYGRDAHAAVEAARSDVAALVGAESDEVVFTSGGTEANNLAIFGTLPAGSSPRHLITSSIEHPATAAPAAELERRGHRVTRIAVSAAGAVSADDVERALSDDTALVTIMHANNETGVVQPIRPIVELCHARGVRVHTDAAQSAAKLDVAALGADLISIAGHKLGAPKGVGALIVRRGTALTPLTLGASHERGLRPGTENVASIVGLGVACRRARGRTAEDRKRVASLRDGLWWRLRARHPDLVAFGQDAERLPNTLLVAAPGTRGSEVLGRVPELAASTGVTNSCSNVPSSRSRTTAKEVRNKVTSCRMIPTSPGTKK